MRYTVTSELDPELFAELERERCAAGLSRSAAMRQGAEWWIAQRKEHGEERIGRAEGRHRQLLRRIDYLIGMIQKQERVQKEAAEGEEQEDQKPEQGQYETPQRPDGALAQARKRARRRTE